MPPAPQENGLRRSRRQPPQQASSATEKNNENKNQEVDTDPESEVDELSDSDDSNSDDGEDRYRLETSKATTTDTQRKKRAANPSALESPQNILQDLDEDDDIDTLYGQVLIHTSPMDTIIEEWIEKYKGPEKMEAVQDLINFIIRSCGTKEKIDPKAIEDDDYIVEALQKVEKKLSSDRYIEYPIASKLRKYKTLKADLITFWKKLVDECQYDVIYDGLLVETLQAWLATMSSSTFRPFRHTATVVALNLISALSIVANRAVQEKQITNRQLGAERRKNNKGAASERQKMLEDKSKALTNKEKRLNGYLKHYFESIFVHRCRDVEAVIRVECIKQLGEWMEQYPGYFLDNQYLRYIGWLLNDKSTSVRTESIKSIIALYDRESNAMQMKPFMQRFKTRIVEMATFEADQITRVQAINLCVSLTENSILDDTDCADLGALIYSDLPKIRSAIAPLVHLTFAHNFVTPKMDEVKAKAATLPPVRNTGRRAQGAGNAQVDEKAIEFKCLANLLLEYNQASQKVKKPKKTDTDDSESVDNEMELDAQSDVDQQSSDKLRVDPRFGGTSSREQSRTTQAVISLFRELPILQEWKALVDFLLKDYSASKTSNSQSTRNELDQYYQLTDDEENVLIETLVTVTAISIEQSAERKQKSKKKMATEEDTKNQISQHLAQTLPRLMTKYAADANKIAEILVLPQLINLSAYTDLRMPKSYELLLEDVKKMFLRHTTSQVHLNAALAIKCLTSFESMASATEASLNELRDELAVLFKRTFADKNLQAATLSENDFHTFVIALSRYQRIIEVIDITEMFEETFADNTRNVQVILQILDRGRVGNAEESAVQMIVSAATILFQYLAWKSHQILGNSTDGNANGNLSSFIALRNNIVHTLTDLALNVDSSHAVDSIRHMAFQMFVDLHWLFSNEQFRRLHVTDGSSLMLRCAPNLQAAATEYVEKELDKWAQAYNTEETEEEAGVDATDEDRSSPLLSDPKKQYELLTPVAAFAKAIILGIFDTHLAAHIVKRYRTLGDELDEAIKAMIHTIKDGLNAAPNSKLASDTLTMYMDSLKESFIYHTKEQHLKLDKPLQLVRLLAASIKAADSDPFHKTSPDLLTEKLHIAGITYCISKAGGYSKINKQESKVTCLKFFKLLTLFSPLLTRARDVAKIHRHAESLLEEHGFSGELDGKDWDAYNAYLASINIVLQKKGLRYDASSRGSNQRHLANVDQNRPEEIERLQANPIDELEESDEEPLQRGTKQTGKKVANKSKRGTKRKAEANSKHDAKQIRLSDMLQKL